MKKPIVASLALVLSLASTDLAAQKQREQKIDEFPNRLEEEIDRFISRLRAEFTSDFSDDLDTLDRKPRSSVRTADIDEDSPARTYTGTTLIRSDEIVKGNIVVKGGDLTVLGTIDGDVLVVGGTLYVKDSGVVTGNARVINGDIVKSDDGRIEGSEDKSSSAAASYRADKVRFRRLGTSFDVPWLSEIGNIDNVIVRYNRVEGVFLGMGSEKKFYWDGRRSWSAYGSVGWGFRSHTWRYALGLTRQISLTSTGSQLIEFGAEGYSLTDSKDKWIISTNENSAAAFFIHEDFLDYFSRRGGTGYVAWLTQGSVLRTELRAGYAVDRYDSLTMKTDWALFGGDKRFRPNPPILEGKMRSATATFNATTINRTSRGPEGWLLTSTAEFGLKMKGSGYSFNQFIVDVRRYQPLGQYDNFNIRARIGSSDGVLPPQRMFEIGGLGTMHGFRYKSASGNRLVLLNAEYIVDGDFLDDLDFWPSDLFGGLNFLILSDAGIVRTKAPTSKPTSGFGKITWGEFQNSLGAGLANRTGSFRVAYNWRTDERGPGVWTFRFSRPF